MLIRSQYGFSLIEMMITLAVGSLVTAGLYGSFVQQQKVYTLQNQIVDMQQNARLGMDLMVGELRMAGFNPTGEAEVGFQVGEDSDITGAHSIRFALDLTDNPDGRGECTGPPDGDSEDCNENITYRLYDSRRDFDFDLGRKSGDGRITPVIENVTGLDFCYFLASAPNGPCVANPTPAEFTDIRFVQVTLTTQTAAPDPHYHHPLNGNGYRTFTLTSLVKIRNLGLR